MLFSISTFISLALTTTTHFTSAWGQLNDEFRDPAPEYRPKFRYWLPDASISADTVANDIREAKAAGAGGLEILPFYLYGFANSPSLPDWSQYGFGTPAFVSLFKSILQTAKQTGIVIDYSLGANQGQGVPTEVGVPGLAVQLLMGNTTISPKGSFSAPVPMARLPTDIMLSGLGFMHPLQQYQAPNLTAVIAFEVISGMCAGTGIRTVHLNQSSFIDLMPLVEDGWSLQWAPPDSTKTYKIFSFWEAYTNQRSCDPGPNATDFVGNGSWTVDHFSKAGAAKVTDFWDKYILSDNEVAHLLRHVGKYAWEDSMEFLAALYWTPGLLDRFRERHGYELTPYLPVLFGAWNSWGGYIPVYDEIYGFGNEMNVGKNVYQMNYRDILNDGYQEYLSHFQEWTHSIGNQYSTQPAYNMPLQMFSDIPLVDAPEGESLGFGQLVDTYRQFSGPAHLTNKAVISTELGAVRVPAYTLRVPDLLQQIKRSFAGGFSMNVLHGFPSTTAYPNTTWPGYTTFWYEFTDMWNPIQPAWQHMKDALDYVGRNQWVLQQGSPKVDLVFYHYASPWKAQAQYKSTNLQNLGYTYDYLGPDNLISAYATVKESTLGAPAYQALIFNKQTVATVEAAEALIKLSSSGLPIIFIGPPPSQSYPNTPSNQLALETAISKLVSLPNSKVFQIESVDKLPGTLLNSGIDPRVALNCSSNPVFPVWRSTGDVEYIYFFNDQVNSTHCTARISAHGVIPYIYDAWIGSQTPLLQYSTMDSAIIVPIFLKANETLILALHRSAPAPKCTFLSTSGGVTSLDSKPNGTFALITDRASLTTSTGRTYTFNASLPQPTSLTAWDLLIEDWHSDPDRFAIKTEITHHTFRNISLVPWNTISASLNPVSGVGHYTTNFTVPTTPSPLQFVGILSLPPIQHTARAYLDGRLLPPIDPASPILELGDLESGRTYALKIDVTTTLFNRIKAEADRTWVAGAVAAERQSGYRELPYEGYGLVGSVKVEWGQWVRVEC
ncbi:hypothetical protein CC78DRAFT_479443 [Lojkania enalia]|uniref:Secreted protein n=1 Tax=Lojkania enalia TaxID=147567 RepID=A0A9P4JW16_9PLEO|nr:hypothetical protein CC78DRAFT_479443 [Didymosphaeria enalia]